MGNMSGDHSCDAQPDSLCAPRFALHNEDGVEHNSKDHVPFCLWPTLHSQESLLIERLKDGALRAMGGVDGATQRHTFAAGPSALQLAELLQGCTLRPNGVAVESQVPIESFIGADGFRALPDNKKKRGIKVQDNVTYKYYPRSDRLKVSGSINFGELASGGQRVGHGNDKSGKLSATMKRKLENRRASM